MRCSVERTWSMLSTPYLHTGWAFENCALGCSLGLIFSGYVPLATSSPGIDPGDEFGTAGLSDSYHIKRHLYISHNAPPKILHNLCFSFLLDFIAVLREIVNNAHAKFGRGGGGGGQRRCIMGNVEEAYTWYSQNQFKHRRTRTNSAVRPVPYARTQLYHPWTAIINRYGCAYAWVTGHTA